MNCQRFLYATTITSSQVCSSAPYTPLTHFNLPCKNLSTTSLTALFTVPMQALNLPNGTLAHHWNHTLANAAAQHSHPVTPTQKPDSAQQPQQLPRAQHCYRCMWRGSIREHE